MRTLTRVLAGAVLAMAGLVTTSAAEAAVPPLVVTMGDSAISGEAGRWAGNTNNESWRVDALGSSAYYDNATNTGETIPGCHRSKTAQAHIGGGVASVNLACSGARTYTSGTGEDQDFKPGIDFYLDSQGRKGQARALQELAPGRNVKAIVLMIGANNYGFADIVQRCLTNWASSPTWWKNYCSDDSDIVSRFTSTRQAQETANVRGAIWNVVTAMSNAGYSTSQYTIIAQTYWSPIPRGSQFRYSESGWSRQEIGGCGFWNRDADWANDVVVPAMNNTMKNAAAQTGLANIRVLDLRDSLLGRRLCENTVGLLEERGVYAWWSTGAVDKTEWVSQVRTFTTIGGPYQLQEGMHSSYWGQRAMRNCLRLAYNAGAVRAGRCVRSANGLNAQGEPFMTLL